MLGSTGDVGSHQVCARVVTQPAAARAWRVMVASLSLCLDRKVFRHAHGCGADRAGQKGRMSKGGASAADGLRELEQGRRRYGCAKAQHCKISATMPTLRLSAPKNKKKACGEVASPLGATRSHNCEKTADLRRGLARTFARTPWARGQHGSAHVFVRCLPLLCRDRRVLAGGALHARLRRPTARLATPTCLIKRRCNT